MRQFQDVNGGVLTSAREYDIAVDTQVRVGMVVTLTDGLVVPAAAAEKGAILGYAAESHSGKEEALDPRANGAKIMVQDAPGAVAISPAPVVTASGGTATTVTVDAMAAFVANAFKGGYLKGADGQVRRVTTSAVAAGVLTLTLNADGVVPVAGDQYALFPPAGFAAGNLSTGRDSLVLTATAALPLQVVGRNEGCDMILTVATKHLLAAGR